MRDKFASYHPVINFTFFIVAIVCGMILLHPAFLAASVLLSMLYYLTAKGRQGWKFVGGMIPLLLVLSMMNPLFNICSEFLIERIIMADTRKKASMSQVLAEIKPYITKKIMTAPCVKEQDIQFICQILLPRYKNVQLM